MTRKIKILFTIPNFDTAGSGKVVYDLVKGLDKNIFEPEICCVHDKGDYFKVVKALGVKIHLFPFSVPYRPFLTFPFRVLKIVRFFKQHQFDLIHSWHWSSDVSEPLAAKLAGIPFVYTKKAMGWGNRSWLWRSKLSTKIIAINNDMLSEFFSTLLTKTNYIPLGVDTHYFKPLPKSYMLPEGITFKADDFVIVSIANLVPVKGIELLLESVKQLDDPKIKVLLVGSYDNSYGLALKHDYGNDSILFLGKKLDVRPYLALADLFVIPTKDEGRKEGLPIAPLEAMASGRIVIGSTISGIKDILKPFPECLFEAGSISHLTEKIQYIKSMAVEEKQQLAKQMYLTVCQQFSLEKCIEHHHNLYQQILKPY